MLNMEKQSSALNSELEAILSKPDLNDEVKKYLKSYFRYSVLRRYVKWIVGILFITSIVCASIYYIPILNWNASAVGRLVLIKLVLPYYDWQYLYKSRCLVEHFKDGKSTAKGYKDYDVFSGDECAVCENLGNKK